MTSTLLNMTSSCLCSFTGTLTYRKLLTNRLLTSVASQTQFFFSSCISRSPLPFFTSSFISPLTPSPGQLSSWPTCSVSGPGLSAPVSLQHASCQRPSPAANPALALRHNRMTYYKKHRQGEIRGGQVGACVDVCLVNTVNLQFLPQM